jgi:hypothetical protein
MDGTFKYFKQFSYARGSFQQLVAHYKLRMPERRNEPPSAIKVMLWYNNFTILILKTHTFSMESILIYIFIYLASIIIIKFTNYSN